jgi:hypothetical protein
MRSAKAPVGSDTIGAEAAWGSRAPSDGNGDESAATAASRIRSRAEREKVEREILDRSTPSPPRRPGDRLRRPTPSPGSKPECHDARDFPSRAARRIEAIWPRGRCTAAACARRRRKRLRATSPRRHPARCARLGSLARQRAACDFSRPWEDPGQGTSQLGIASPASRSAAWHAGCSLGGANEFRHPDAGWRTDARDRIARPTSLRRASQNGGT